MKESNNMRCIVYNLLIAFTLVLCHSCLPKGGEPINLSPNKVTLSCNNQSIEIHSTMHYYLLHAFIGKDRNCYSFDYYFYDFNGTKTQEGWSFTREENGNYSFVFEDWLIWEYDYETRVSTVTVTENNTGEPRYAEIRVSDDGPAYGVFYLTQAAKDDN